MAENSSAGIRGGAGVALGAAGEGSCGVAGELAGLDVASVAGEQAGERLERVAVGEVSDGGARGEAGGAGDGDDLALIGDERHARIGRAARMTSPPCRLPCSGSSSM